MGRGAGGRGVAGRAAPGKTGISPKQLHRFQGVPDAHLALIKGVKVSEAIPGNGIYNDKMQKIYLNSRTATDHTARHEVGHAVWNRVLTQGQRESWTRDYDASMTGRGDLEARQNWGNRFYISAYATTNDRESFADAYSYATSGTMGGGNRLGFASDSQDGILRDILGGYYSAR